MGGKLLDGANSKGGTRGQGHLGAKWLLVSPMNPDTLEKKAWLILQQANSGRSRHSAMAKAGHGNGGFAEKSALEGLCGMAARLQLQLDEAYKAGYSPEERMKMERLLSVYQGTIEQLRIYEGVFASLCGPREVLRQKTKDVISNAEQQLQKPGIAGFIEKSALPWAVGLFTGTVAVKAGASAWLAAKLSGLLGIAAPLFRENAAVAIGFVLAATAIWAVAALAAHRMRAIEKRRIASLKAIGESEREIQEAIVRLVVLEYQRLATKHAIKVGVPIESEAIIHRRMEQLVFEIRKKHGFELPLPAEVKREVWPLLHRERTGFMKKTWLMLHAHLEILFGRHERRAGAQGWQHSGPQGHSLDSYNLCAVA